MKANQKIAKFTLTLLALKNQGIDIPGLIMSHPGFGKTSTMKMIAKHYDFNLFTLIPSQNSSDDVLGIQSVQNGKLVRLAPDWDNQLREMAKNNKTTILFIDEISTCDAYIQGPLLDVIFNRTVCGKKLPENVFIIAAGNYASDLDNEFHMSAPLVNRFMLLNLTNNDFSINEVLNNTFGAINTSDELEDYLDIKEVNQPAYSFSAFKDWLQTSKEVVFGNAKTYEDAELGLLGFTSVRSLSYSLNFAKCYMQKFNDDTWIQVVGDTLGKSSARKDNIPYQKVIESAKKQFKLNNATTSADDFSTLIHKYATETDKYNTMMLDELEAYKTSNALPFKTFDYINKLHSAIIATSVDDITPSAYATFKRFVKFATTQLASCQPVLDRLIGLIDECTKKTSC